MTVFALGPDEQEWCAELRALTAERLSPLAEKGRRAGSTDPWSPPSANWACCAACSPPTAPCAPWTCVCCGNPWPRCARRRRPHWRSRGWGPTPSCCPGPRPSAPAGCRRWPCGRAVASFALSEPGAGSDAAALSLAAEPDGPDGWRLSGEKCWISNAPEADFATVFARTGGGAGARGVTAFLVPADRPGLTGAHLDMLSPHPIGTLVCDGTPVTRADVLGEVDGGFAVAMATLNLFRPSVGAFAVGMAQAALDAALTHAGERTAFGGPLKDLQSVGHQLAEMATRVESARLLVYAAASAYDTGAPDIARRSAMAKLLATETAQYVVDAAVQIHGARALRRGHLLEHLYREVRAPRIYEGATEVQRSIIAKELYRGRP